MKKLLTMAAIVFAALGFTACDDDPKEGDAKAVYTITIECNDFIKQNFDLVLQTSGNSTSMNVGIVGETLEAGDLAFTTGRILNGKIGKNGSRMIAVLALDPKSKDRFTADNYTMDIKMYMNVVSYDADGNKKREKKILAAKVLENAGYTAEEFENTFFGKNHYLVEVGASVNTSYEITATTGTIVK